MSEDVNTSETLLDSVRTLVPMIEAAAETAEAARKPDDDVINALAEIGVFRAYVPKRFGGFELDYETFMHIGMTIARACTSTAWVTTFYMEHNWLLAHFPPQAQEHVWGQAPYFLAPGSISPTGNAEIDGDDYLLSGRWQWGTGIMHADWVIVSGLISGESPELRMFMLPTQDIQVEDTWFVDGMVATGSNDIVAEGVRVPKHMSQSVALMSIAQTDGAQWHNSPTFRTPMINFKGITAACPAVGCAQRAVELFKERIQGRSLWGRGSNQMEQTAAQMRLGDLTTRADMCEREMLAVARDLAQLGYRDEPSTPEERASIRMRCTHIVRQSRDIVRDVVEASGASAHRLSHPLQRLHRDIHTLSCHTVFDADIASELYGQVLLGIPPTSPV